MDVVYPKDFFKAIGKLVGALPPQNETCGGSAPCAPMVPPSMQYASVSLDHIRPCY